MNYCKRCSTSLPWGDEWCGYCAGKLVMDAGDFRYAKLRHMIALILWGEWYRFLNRLHL